MKLIQMNSDSEELNKIGSNKPLTYLSPGCYKRRITNLLSTLEKMEIYTLIQDSTKRELINTFRSKRFQIIKDFLEFTSHVQKICAYDQNYRRNKMRRVKRRKLNKLKFPVGKLWQPWRVEKPKTNRFKCLTN